MRFMLTLIGPEGGYEDITPEQIKDEMKNWEAFGKESMEAGAFIAGDGLQPTNTAMPSACLRWKSRWRRSPSASSRC